MVLQSPGDVACENPVSFLSCFPWLGQLVNGAMFEPKSLHAELLQQRKNSLKPQTLNRKPKPQTLNLLNLLNPKP